MEFYLTQMPDSFLGRLEGFAFFLILGCAVFLLHHLHNREDRIIIKVPEEKPKKAKK